MSKARNLADLLDANGDVKQDSLDNVPPFENITDTGTEGTKVATGTTAQRGSTAGQIRFNSDIGLAEYYTGSEFKAIDAPPTVSSVGNTNISDTQISGGYDLTISGSSFNSGATVKFIGDDGTEYSSPSVTVNSGTSITARVPSLSNANEPYDVQVSNSSGLSGLLADAININATPAFSVASGSLGSLYNINREASNLTAVTATDPDGDSITFTVTSGTIPTGLTFNSDGTWTGTANAETSDTTYSFTVQASDGTNTSTRNYSITVKAPSIVAFTSVGTSTWTVPSSLVGRTAEVLVVAGGGGGGRAGGGGAGGVLHHTGLTLASSYSVTVGAGGLGHYGDSNQESLMRGGNSLFGALTAFGGGGGAYSATNGYPGGSGGGHGFNGSTQSGGASIQTSNNGGTGYGSAGASGQAGSRNAGGGGGGVNGTGGAGTDATSYGGAGGYFANFNTYGTNASNGTSGTRGYFGGGGGGDGHSYTNSPGGVGGGGTSTARSAPNAASKGQDNTGGGGGAAHYSTSGFNSNMNGGSGVVLVRV